jgi:acylphosphatase
MENYIDNSNIHCKFVYGMDNKLHYKIHISGHVQGVGFRWSSVHEARKRGISGIVKNLPDGRVYIEAEGSVDQLNMLVEWCKRGPVSGFVDLVTVEESQLVNYRDFRIEF